MTPHLVDGVDLRSLPIGPEEAFVLSRIDGLTSAVDIASSTGLAGDVVSEILARLAALGAVELGEQRPVERPRPQDEGPARNTKLERPIIEAPAERSVAWDAAAALYDPAELDEPDVEVELPRRRQILDTFYKLDHVTHYELLAVGTDADKKAIKQAYFSIVTLYHPDKYFGKKLGKYKPKLEKIFERVTHAHDVLTRNQTREEYDRYLSANARRRALDTAMTDTAAHERELERVRREIEAQARVVERASTVPKAPAPMDIEDRKRALARKLGRSAPPGARPSAPPPPERAEVKEVVADDLRRRYEARVANVQKSQAARYIAAADKALQMRDKASAANALRIALSLAPGDGELSKRVEALQAEVNAELAETYLQSAQYEERNQRWAQAADSYQKAARGRLAGRERILERIAFCMLEAEGDLRKAAEFAQEAVSLAPENAQLRVTLARIYLALDLRKSALGEFERASHAAPQDDTIKDWIRRLKKGEA